MTEPRPFRGLLFLGAMMLSVAFATLVGAANGATSVTSKSGGARWGFLIAIAVGVAAFVIGGLFIIMRSRREYLDMEARKASRPPEDMTGPCRATNIRRSDDG